MFITSPPCQEAEMTLIWEGRIDGEVVMTLETHGKVYRAEGITLASLVDRMSKRTGTVEMRRAKRDPQDDEKWYYLKVKDTTLHDQIASCKARNSKRVMQMSMESEIYLTSVIAPTESEYQEMSIHGHINPSKF